MKYCPNLCTCVYVRACMFVCLCAHVQDLFDHFIMPPIVSQQQEWGRRWCHDIRGHRGATGNGGQTIKANTSNHLSDWQRERLYVLIPYLCILITVLLVDHHKSGKSGKKRKKTKGSNLPEENNSSIVSLPLRDMMSTKSFSSGNIITPTSTLTRNKPTHSQVHLMPERSILDRNASTYSSFLHMRGVNTRWERRWFTLQKSVLTHTR